MSSDVRGFVMDSNEIIFQYKILNAIQKKENPVGASFLSLKMGVPQATIGRKLQLMEHEGLLLKISNKGRQITEKGIFYLKDIERELNKMKKAKDLISEPEVISEKRLIDILKTRRALERETVYHATLKATQQDLADLNTLITLQEEKILSGQLGDEEDYKFHTLIAKLSGNEVIEHILYLILTQRRAYSQFSYIRKKSPTSIVKNHRKIIKAMVDKNPKFASELMELHIDEICSDVMKYFINIKKKDDKK